MDLLFFVFQNLPFITSNAAAGTSSTSPATPAPTASLLRRCCHERVRKVNIRLFQKATLLAFKALHITTHMGYLSYGKML